jgi:ubiquitin carboxyl-terminal hydrolase 9/24
VGVTIHRGTAEHGHYYSLINTKRGKDEADESKQEWFQTERDPWKVFDDETVKYFNFNDLKTEAFGGTSGSNNGIQDQDLNAYYMQSGTANSYG